ncbi:MAG TPA: LuxR C-terminal-related transcriptional regulator [Anaerolineae bacterium]|jgi:LuxR family maltose regulon positive regulatory protein|nr:LuxR C-terminal-related transcriptional regulator [Anaerolineae bacterium]
MYDYHMAADFLLQTKFYIPSPPAGYVPRQRLVECLEQGLGGKLILISAPAGFGKTTLLAEWLAENNFPAAWLSLEKDDNDLARFMAYFAACLGAYRDDLGREAMALLQSGQTPDSDRIMGVLVNELASLKEPFVLVLDDIHYIDNPLIYRAIALLIEHQPPSMHLVLAGRADPGFPVSRLRALGQMLEIRAGDLRFSLEEAAVFLERAGGRSLSPESTRTLWERTEGWPAGLQLAALSLQRQEDARAFIAGLTGTQEYIADFLQDEVLGGQPQAIQEFLLCTSILDQLCGPLCDALTGHDDGHETLEELAEQNLFLLPLDDVRRWYRYHRLFADLLQQRLRRSQPDLLPELHCRASRWFEDQGLRAQAIDHALEAADFERAALLLEETADETLMRSQFGTLTGWLKRLPEKELRRHPSLSVYLAWSLLLNGQPLDIIQSWLPETDAESGEMPPQVLPFHAYIGLVQGHYSRSARLARQALATLPQEEGYLRGMATWLLAVAGTQQSDLSDGAVLLEEMARQAKASGNVTLLVLALCNQGELRHVAGRLPEAKALYQQALNLSTLPDGQYLPIAGSALNGLGEIALEWNDLLAAEKYLTLGHHLSRQWSFLAALDGYANLALLRQTLGDEAAALQILEEAMEIARRSDFTEVDDWLVKLVRARLAIAQGKTVQAWHWALETGFERSGASDDTAAEEGQSLASRQRKYERVVFARLLLAENEPERALGQLALALPLLEHKGRVRAVIEVRSMTALALQAMGQDRAALQVISQALRLAQPGGFRRLFLDEGQPMARLLSKLQSRLAAYDGYGEVDPSYIGQLLAGFGAPAATRPAVAAPDDAAEAPLIQPLTERELEVLALIDAGLSNQEIANKLVISLSTVKVHTRNIYGKLAVRNRAGAVSRAHELGLLGNGRAAISAT